MLILGNILALGTSEIVMIVLVSKPIFLFMALVVVTMNTGRARQQRLLAHERRDLLLSVDDD